MVNTGTNDAEKHARVKKAWDAVARGRGGALGRGGPVRGVAGGAHRAVSVSSGGGDDRQHQGHDERACNGSS